MKTLTLPPDGTDNFTLNIDVSFTVRTTKNLMAADGSVKLEGKTLSYNFNQPADLTPAGLAAKTTLQAAVETAVATYYQTVNTINPS